MALFGTYLNRGYDVSHNISICLGPRTICYHLSSLFIKKTNRFNKTVGTKFVLIVNTSYYKYIGRCFII